MSLLVVSLPIGGIVADGRVTLAIAPEAERLRGYFMLLGSAFFTEVRREK